jgi:hypothetical protein
MATNITNLQPNLDLLTLTVMSITISGVTDRITRLRITISSPINSALSIPGTIIINTSQPLDINNQRPWSIDFNLNDDFFTGDLNCNDTVDINIEWLDTINGWTQEQNFPVQMTIDCTAAKNCSIIIASTAVGVRNPGNQENSLDSITIKGTATFCESLLVKITNEEQPGRTFSKSVNVANTNWEVKFENESPGWSKYFYCNHSYFVEVVCNKDSACEASRQVIITCINQCSQIASLQVTRLSDNNQISNPGILHCMFAGRYRIAVTAPDDINVLRYEWYKDTSVIPIPGIEATHRSYEIILAAGENVKYTAVAIQERCTAQQNVTFACDSGPIDCLVSDWSNWGRCINGIQTRTKTIITPATNGGQPCPQLVETRNCSDESSNPVDCAVSDWNIGQCINGQRTDIRTVVTEPRNGGRLCPELSRTVNCSTPPPPICDLCCIWNWINIGFFILTAIFILITFCMLEATVVSAIVALGSGGTLTAVTLALSALNIVMLWICLGLIIAGLASFILWLILCVYNKPNACSLLATLMLGLSFITAFSFGAWLVLWATIHLGCAAGAFIDLSWFGFLLSITVFVFTLLGCFNRNSN